MRKSIIIGGLLLALLATSCERFIDSRDPVRSMPTEGAVPTNLQVTPNSGTVRLTWDIDDPSNVSRYRVYAGEVRPDGEPVYTLRDSTSETEITLEGLQINQEYAFRVAAVLRSGLEWDRSSVVYAYVSYLSISISGGAEYTRSRTVAVTANTPTSVTHVMLSEDSTLAGAEFLPLTGSSRSFTLSPGDGTKWIYARLQFGDGAVSGETLRDSIVLDTRAEISGVSFDPPQNGEYFTEGEVVTFFVDADETDGAARVGFPGVSRVNLLDDGLGADPLANDGVYTGTWTIPNNFTVSNGDVTGNFSDAAGNSAASMVAVTPLTIYTTPLPVTVSALGISGTEITLAWTESVSGNFAAYRIYRSATSTVTEASTLVTTITEIDTTSFTEDALAPGTTYYYRVYVYDISGLTAGSNTVAGTTTSGAAALRPREAGSGR